LSFHAGGGEHHRMSDRPHHEESRRDPVPQAFARRVTIVVAITLAMAAVALFLWYSLYVLLLAFAAVLVAAMLRGLASWLAARTRLPAGAALAAVVLGWVAFFVGLWLLLAPAITRQFTQLADRLPESVNQVQDRLRQTDIGRRILGEAHTEANAPVSADGSQPAVTPPAPDGSLATKAIAATTQPATVGKVVNYGRRVLEGLFTLVLVLIVGIYLAAQPRYYVEGFLKLFPKAERARLREVMLQVGRTLQWWLMGQLVPMVCIGTFVGGGLWLIGVPMWLPLGILTALLNFIPSFGPIIAAIPQILIALAADPTKAIWVVALNIAAQNLEGYLITPLVQRRAVEMPPALTIHSQVLMGMLLGPLGVILAAPLTAAAIVVVKMLYVEDTLGTPVDVVGSHKPAAAPSG
jgi:predicted PurR-regulated permease PerM